MTTPESASLELPGFVTAHPLQRYELRDWRTSSGELGAEPFRWQSSASRLRRRTRSILAACIRQSDLCTNRGYRTPKRPDVDVRRLLREPSLPISREAHQLQPHP